MALGHVPTMILDHVLTVTLNTIAAFDITVAFVTVALLTHDVA
jgi:hypothetical protein